MGKEFLFSVGKRDLKIQTFAAGGKGGQHQNKTASGVRIIHEASGARAESREERSQGRNKKIAFKRLAASPKFVAWMHRRVHEISTGETIEQKTERSMVPENLKIEYDLE